MGIDLKGVRIDDPVILAPMSGISDQPFRRLAKRLGAGLVVSEMIASQAMVRASQQSMKMTSDLDTEEPVAVQLAGCDPEIMAEAAYLNQERGADIIDINFGCPVKKIVNKLAGSALMREEELAGRILEAVVKAVDLPVTMKMRLGWDWDSLNAPRFAQMAEETGIRMITVHGRTRCQLYNGEADWEAIRATREATSLPLIVNGDIQSLSDVDEALAQSGADGVMIGRGACGRPWFLGQVSAHLRGDEVPEDPSLAEQYQIALEHYRALLEHYGEEQGVRIARKHLAWYVNGLRGANLFRETINREKDPKKVMTLLAALYGQEETSVKEAA